MARTATRIVVVVAVCLVATLAAGTIAQAVDQFPKNGCESPQSYSGYLTSPVFNPSADGEPISFQGWFEIESVNPDIVDQMVLEESADGGQTWIPVANLLQGAPPNTGGEPFQPYSNRGTDAPPSFQLFNFTLPLGDRPVQIRFGFDTMDTSYQGFRGLAIDNISVGSSFVSFSEDFESGGPGWTFDPASGPGGPAWRVLRNPQTFSVKSPEITPDLVTLPDSGALPAAPAPGSRVAWFGNADSGTFCGPDFANRIQLPDFEAPDTTITDGPPASTTGKSASLSFTSSEANSSFQCSLDGGAPAPCSSPQSYTGLAPGAHTFQVSAIDPAGNVDPTPAVHVWNIRATLDDLPRPEQGVDVNIQTAAGTVLVGVRAAGARAAGAGASQKGVTFVPLEEARQVPVGSFLDTRRGTVQLVSARSSRRVQSGRFGGGLFQVLQSRARRARGLTEMRLKGSSFRRCRTGRRGRAGAAQVSRRTIRRVRSNANGNFRSRGRHSSATVRGTIWITADRCDGTLTTVKRGRVAVRDFRRKRTILLRAGKSYLARPRG